MLNVFIHIDGSSSAPFCQLGKCEVYRWANGDCVLMEGTQCDNPACTCNIQWPISRKGTIEEKRQFYITQSQLAGI
jgi:hypothetical protein